MSRECTDVIVHFTNNLLSSVSGLNRFYSSLQERCTTIYAYRAFVRVVGVEPTQRNATILQTVLALQLQRTPKFDFLFPRQNELKI